MFWYKLSGMIWDIFTQDQGPARRDGPHPRRPRTKTSRNRTGARTSKDHDFREFLDEDVDFRDLFDGFSVIKGIFWQLKTKENRLHWCWKLAASKNMVNEVNGRHGVETGERVIRDNCIFIKYIDLVLMRIWHWIPTLTRN